MRKFNITKDPHEKDCNIYKRRVINIKEGVTVLTGCNGSGKTTLLQMIKSDLEKNKIPVISYDNLHDGGVAAKEQAMLSGDMRLLATSVCSSEGENIILNMTTMAKRIGYFVRDCENPKRHNIFDDDEDIDEKPEDISKPEEYWILFDAIDSGLSIDNIMDVKTYLFEPIIKDITAKNRKVYIIVSANSYEMCKDEQCFDVQSCNYIDFPDYNTYRQYILESREIKDKIYKDFEDKHKKKKEIR